MPPTASAARPPSRRPAVPRRGFPFGIGRTAATCATALVAAAALVSSVGGAQPIARRDDGAGANRAVVGQALDGWARGGTRFFDDVLAPDVVWTVMGSGPSARTYRGRQAFLDSAVAPFSARLASPLVPTVRGLWADGDQVIALFDGRATARDGRPYRNTYAWLFTMRGGRAIAVTAFLDLPAYDRVLREVRPAP